MKKMHRVLMSGILAIAISASVMSAAEAEYGRQASLVASMDPADIKLLFLVGPLDEDIFRSCADFCHARAGNEALMELFVCRVISDILVETNEDPQEYEISRAGLAGFHPWYWEFLDMQKERPTLKKMRDALRREIQRGTWIRKTQGGFPAAVIEQWSGKTAYGERAPLTQEGYEDVVLCCTVNDSNEPMTEFIVRVAAERGIAVDRHSAAFRDFVPAYSDVGIDGNHAEQSIVKLKGDIFLKAFDPGSGFSFIHNKRPAMKDLIVCTGLARPDFNARRYNEHYFTVVDRCLETEDVTPMIVYILLYLGWEGKGVTSFTDLSAFAPWYSGHEGVQTFSALASELSKKAWVVERSDYIDGQGRQLQRQATYWDLREMTGARKNRGTNGEKRNDILRAA